MKYLPHIDGLRAISVLLVVLFHLYPDFLPNGYLGVDFFFVISGYLITSIIWSDLERKKFSFINFYKRRANRLLPSLEVVLVILLFIGFFVFLPEDFQSLGKNIKASALFLSNFSLFNEVSYFDRSADVKPLLHFWSLAIEEQFYLFWPLLLLLAHKASAKVRKIILVSLVVISAGAYLWVYDRDKSAAFYLPWFRFWELGCGGLLTFWAYEGKIDLKFSRVKQFFGRFETTALITSLLAIVVLSKVSFADQHRKYIPLVTVALAMFLITRGSINIVGKILSSKPMIWMGKISYPFYLWHWPPLAILTIIKYQIDPQNFEFYRIVSVLLAVVLSYLTYLYVEQNFRLKNTKSSAILLYLGLGLLGGLGALIQSNAGFGERFPQEIRKYIEPIDFKFEQMARFGVCHFDTRTPNNKAEIGKNGCVEKKRPLIAIWGDSFTASLYPGLKKLQDLSSNSFGIAQYTMCGTPPFLDLTEDNSCVTATQKRKWNKSVLENISATKPELLIIHFYWTAYGTKENIVKRTMETIGAVRVVSPSTKILIVGPAPEWGNWNDGLPRAMVRYWFLNNRQLPPLEMSFGLSEGLFLKDEYYRAEFLKMQVPYVSALNIFCTDGSNCLTRLSEKPSSLTAIDNGHLSSAGSIFLIGKIGKQILSAIH